MTCIIGLVDSKAGTVYMGCDSVGANTHTYRVNTRKDAKVFRNGPFLMGFTSSFRMGQLLRYKLSVPKRQDKQPVYNFMVTTFIDAVRHCLNHNGYATTVDNQESGGVFLVGYEGRLFKIDNDYQVCELLEDSFDAVGCGESYALAVMNVNSHIKNPQKRIKEALATAAKYSAYVQGPFLVKSSRRTT